jgi:hypothetical protein
VQGGGEVAIPTQATFWETFLRFSSSQRHRDLIESFLFRYFLGYARVPARANSRKRRAMLKDIDVEEVFTFLSERARAPASSTSLRTYAGRVWAALLSEFGNVFNRFEASQATRRVFRAFVRNYVRSRDTLVSFNYDTVLERSLPSSYKWHYEQVGEHRTGVRLLKPHGSINWEDGEVIRVTDRPEQRVIVAPTHLKFVQTSESERNETIGYLDRSVQINQIWARMEKEMRQAKALVFIGYSFPVADLYFSSVLRSVLADRGTAPGIVLVNPDAVSIRARLRQRFPLGNVVLRYDLGNFVQSTRSELLHDLESEN